MLLVAVVASVGLVLAIAAWFVIREAGRIAQDPPSALFDLDDAYDWVVEHLSDDVAATLTPEDVRHILSLQLEFFESKGVSANGNRAKEAYGIVVIGGAEQVAFIITRAAATGVSYLPEQIDAVVDTQLSYLRAIGAIGPTADREGQQDSDH